MKKMSVLFLALVLVLGLAGCDDSQPASTTSSRQQESSVVASSGEESGVQSKEESVVSKESEPQSKVESKATSKTTSKVTSKAESKVTSKAESKAQTFDVSKYVGVWDEVGATEATGGVNLEIQQDGSVLSFTYFDISANARRIAESHFTVKKSNVKNNTATASFTDSWGNTGTIKIQFKGSKIVVTVSNVVLDDMANWCTNEGTYTLEKVK